MPKSLKPGVANPPVQYNLRMTAGPIGAPQFLASELADKKNSLFTGSRAGGATVLGAPVEPWN